MPHRRLIELKPDFWQSHVELGGALATIGRLDEAIPCFERGVELAPNNVWAHSVGTNNGAAAVLGTNTAGAGIGYGGFFSTDTTGAGCALYATITGAGNTGYAGYFANTATTANYGLVASTSRTGAGYVTGASNSGGYAGYFTNTSTAGWALYAGTAPSYFAGNVGIGTAAPKAALHVNGGAIVGNDAASCDGNHAGEVKYTSNHVSATARPGRSSTRCKARPPSPRPPGAGISS